MLRNSIATIGLAIIAHSMVIRRQLLWLKKFLGSMLPQYMAFCVSELVCRKKICVSVR